MVAPQLCQLMEPEAVKADSEVVVSTTASAVRCRNWSD